ncbi:MAG: hypothetical protein IPO40_08720 [Fibrobacteres bacterium]|nr:hypothetical protein [Fibrobacterota bacterium]
MICYPHGLSGQEWILIQHNGRNVFQPMPSIRLPAPGAHWVWNMAASNGRSFANMGSMHPYGTSSGNTIQGALRWDILERLPDSSGWIRLKIQQDQKLSRVEFQSAFSTYVLPGPNTSSNHTILQTISIDLRIQRVSGWTLVSKAPAFPFHLAWISRWYNHIEPRNSNPVHLSAKEQWDFGAKEGASDHFRFQMGMDSASLMNSASNSEAGFTSASGDWARYRLVESNLPPEPIPENILEVARNFPESTIRWSIASGRTGTFPGSEFVKRLAALRGQTVFLQARLPDGRLWQGTHVIP